MQFSVARLNFRRVELADRVSSCGWIVEPCGSAAVVTIILVGGSERKDTVVASHY